MSKKVSSTEAWRVYLNKNKQRWIIHVPESKATPSLNRILDVTDMQLFAFFSLIKKGMTPQKAFAKIKHIK